jgi:hypothetical protein
MESSPTVRESRIPARLSHAKSPSPATLGAALSIAEAVFSRNGAPPPPERLSFIRQELEDFLARAGTRSRLMLSFSIRLVAFLAPWFGGQRRRFASLPLAERVAALGALERRLPEPLLAVKALLCLVYYEHPEAAHEVGVSAPQFIARRVT